MTETNLILHPTHKTGKKGRIYEIWLGEELLASGVSPEFNACRVLQERGVTGDVLFWRAGKATWDMRMGIAWGATKSVSETDRTGLRFSKWSPFKIEDKAGDELEDAA